MVLITSLWAILGYIYFMQNMSLPEETILFMAGLAHPLRFLYAVSLALVVPTIVLPAFMVLRSEKFLRGLKGFLERLSLLTQFYLVFDFVGLVIVIIRNV